MADYLVGTNYRTKIQLTFPDIREGAYRDTITCPELLDIINRIAIIFDNSFDTTCIKSIKFQCAYTKDVFGIMIYSTIPEKYESIGLVIPEVSIIGCNDAYLSTTRYFTCYTMNTVWRYSINTFVQSYLELAQFAHNTVADIIDKLSGIYDYTGIGGESCLYAIANKHKFNNIHVYTDNSAIHDTNTYNIAESAIDNCVSTLVDYRDFKLQYQANTFMVINIAKKGLRSFVKQVMTARPAQIVYIGCARIYTEHDCQILREIYDIITDICVPMYPDNPECILSVIQLQLK